MPLHRSIAAFSTVISLVGCIHATPQKMRPDFLLGDEYQGVRYIGKVPPTMTYLGSEQVASAGDKANVQDSLRKLYEAARLHSGERGTVYVTNLRFKTFTRQETRQEPYDVCTPHQSCMPMTTCSASGPTGSFCSTSTSCITTQDCHTEYRTVLVTVPHQQVTADLYHAAKEIIGS